MLKEESTLWVLKRSRMKESEDVFMMTMVILVKMVIQSSSTTEVPRLNSFLSPKLAFKMRKITSLVSWCAFLVLRETYTGSIFVVVAVAVRIIVLFLVFLLNALDEK